MIDELHADEHSDNMSNSNNFNNTERLDWPIEDFESDTCFSSIGVL